MSIDKNKIIESISKMTVSDIMELVKMMEKKFNVSTSNIQQKTQNIEKKDKIKEKTEFNVILKEIGTNKISVIKTIRTITGLGLKESKDLVESSPVIIKESINKKEALKLKIMLEKTGALIELK